MFLALSAQCRIDNLRGINRPMRDNSPASINLRIPGDGDQRSELMSITISK
jgi:hypothetical protein